MPRVRARSEFQRSPSTPAYRVGPADNRANTLLHCPIRGRLNASALAADGLTPTEEARRIDFLTYLLSRGYPDTHVAVETVVLTGLGNQGRNKLRADVIVYDIPVSEVRSLDQGARLSHALLVAEIKRDTTGRAKGVTCQLEPAMRQLPGMRVLGVYWDDVNRLLFTKRLVSRARDTELAVVQDAIANLPPYGQLYRTKPIALDALTSADNLVGLLYNIANVMRSHGTNDEHLRYKETVKLLLARYCDENAARSAKLHELKLQVYEGDDPGFMGRLNSVYETSAKRYSRAKTLFHPERLSELDEPTLRDIVRLIQGVNFSSASNETMQQVFMSFVPVVFKKSLDQYFTPVTLIETMTAMARIGPNDKVADPAMGTADFLTAAMACRLAEGDTDVHQRVFGIDSDQKACDLAVVNMILNRDGQANLRQGDSIAQPELWANEMDVALCNPPFGSRTIESRQAVLTHYDLGHEWEYDRAARNWVITDRVMPSQQLGILFIERCYKLLGDGGRMAIILPEGYLCTASYAYVRQWMLDHFQLLSLVELPRRIFTKSDADLRSNVFIGLKLSPRKLAAAKRANYPIHAELVRRVGFKMGVGYQPIARRDEDSGLEIRDEHNHLVLDSDFDRVRETFAAFTSGALPGHGKWTGARAIDVTSHPNLDMKPRRLMPRALENLRRVARGGHVRLGEIAQVVEETVDILRCPGPSGARRLVEGQDIRAVEGTVLPQEPERCWRIAERKSQNVYPLTYGDIVVGLVRPERRNIGLVVSRSGDLVGSPDGIAIVRVLPQYSKDYPQEWLFAALRSETCRLQFWTESGGTSYGKLSLEHIRGIRVPVPALKERRSVKRLVSKWALSIESAIATWEGVGTDADRKPILNSPTYGLDGDSSDE